MATTKSTAVKAKKPTKAKTVKAASAPSSEG